MKDKQLAWFVLLVATVLIASMVLRACQAPPPNLLQSTTDRHEDVFVPATRAAVLANDAPVRAHATIRRPPGLAGVQGGLPVIAAYRTRPVIGDSAGFVVAWTTRPSPSYPEGPLGPGVYPDQPVALLVSNRLTPPGQLPGGRGGYLQVLPDHVLSPKPGGLLTQSGGTIHLTLPEGLLPALRGLPFYLQLVVGDPRTPAGVVFAPMFELIVGDV